MLGIGVMVIVAVRVGMCYDPPTFAPYRMRQRQMELILGEEDYYKVLKQAQALNRELGYGNYQRDWKKREHEMQRREIMIQTRIKNAKNKMG